VFYAIWLLQEQQPDHFYLPHLQHLHFLPQGVEVVQEQVVVRVAGSTYQHQRDLSQPVMLMFTVSPQLERKTERGCELFGTQEEELN